MVVCMSAVISLLYEKNCGYLQTRLSFAGSFCLWLSFHKMVSKSFAYV